MITPPPLFSQPTPLIRPRPGRQNDDILLFRWSSSNDTLELTDRSGLNLKANSRSVPAVVLALTRAAWSAGVSVGGFVMNYSLVLWPRFLSLRSQGGPPLGRFGSPVTSSLQRVLSSPVPPSACGCAKPGVRQPPQRVQPAVGVFGFLCKCGVFSSLLYDTFPLQMSRYN